jgi:hypothetical protein
VVPLEKNILCSKIILNSREGGRFIRPALSLLTTCLDKKGLGKRLTFFGIVNRGNVTGQTFSLEEGQLLLEYTAKASIRI